MFFRTYFSSSVKLCYKFVFNHLIQHELLCQLTDHAFLMSYWTSLVAQMVENCLQCRRPRFNPWVGEIPLEKEMATHSSILAWRILLAEDPGSCSPWDCKELDMTARLTQSTHYSSL